jgi:GT2 family glycosyltransferase
MQNHAGILSKTFAVIVLYKQNLDQSVAYNSFSTILRESNLSMRIMVYDNSPQASSVPLAVQNGFDIQYIHDPMNAGLSKGYNIALKAAAVAGYEWLLLMDQDTIFTSDYVQELTGIDTKLLKDVGAIVPRVVSRDKKRKISPSKRVIGGRFSQDNISAGISKGLSGINSGTLVNIGYFISYNGFNTNYTLDMLDHWYFRKLSMDRRLIYVLKSEIYQELSVFGDFETAVSLLRYRQLLNAEFEYMLEEPLLSKIVFKFRLLLRAMKQLMFKNKSHSVLTFKKLLGISLKGL